MFLPKVIKIDPLKIERVKHGDRYGFYYEDRSLSDRMIGDIATYGCLFLSRTKFYSQIRKTKTQKNG